MLSLRICLFSIHSLSFSSALFLSISFHLVQLCVRGNLFCFISSQEQADEVENSSRFVDFRCFVCLWKTAEEYDRNESFIFFMCQIKKKATGNVPFNVSFWHRWHGCKRTDIHLRTHVLNSSSVCRSTFFISLLLLCFSWARCDNTFVDDVPSKKRFISFKQSKWNIYLCCLKSQIQEHTHTHINARVTHFLSGLSLFLFLLFYVRVRL